MHNQRLERKKQEEESTESNIGLPSFFFGNERVCTYCGDPADGIDHIIPFAYQRSGKRTAAFKVQGGPRTGCCKYCNSIKGDRHFLSFDECCRDIRDRLDDEASPVVWSMREIRKLDYTLRTYVEQQRRRRLWLRGRADWYESRNFLLNLESLLWVPFLEKGNLKYDKFLGNYFEYTIAFVKTLYDK